MHGKIFFALRPVLPRAKRGGFKSVRTKIVFVRVCVVRGFVPYLPSLFWQLFLQKYTFKIDHLKFRMVHFVDRSWHTRCLKSVNKIDQKCVIWARKWSISLTGVDTPGSQARSLFENGRYFNEKQRFCGSFSIWKWSIFDEKQRFCGSFSIWK